MIIQAFIDNCLMPMLKGFNLTTRERQIIGSDIACRLRSILSRWQNAGFRRTLLVLGKEEATFYEPAHASLEIRALVVVAVRNSLLEDAASARPWHPGLRFAISDRQVPLITRAAIQHFSEIDIETETASLELPPTETDVFGYLRRKYPRAWLALSKLSKLSPQTQERNYMPIDGAPPERLPVASTEISSSPHPTEVVESGIDPRMGESLKGLLSLLEQREIDLLFVPSFKALTRSSEKLCRVLEFVLAHDLPLVTPNYYLSATYVAQRGALLRPPHTHDESSFLHITNLTGTVGQHRKVLARIRDQLVQA